MANDAHTTQPNNLRQSAPNQRESVAKKSRRGGRRPGAGARPGNMNALKHGKYSKQFATVGALLAEDPITREALLLIGRRKEMKQTRARQIAAALLTGLMKHARDIAGGPDRLNLPSPLMNPNPSNAQPPEITPHQIRKTLQKTEKPRGTIKHPVQPRRNDQNSDTKSL